MATLLIGLSPKYPIKTHAARYPGRPWDFLYFPILGLRGYHTQEHNPSEVPWLDFLKYSLHGAVWVVILAALVVKAISAVVRKPSKELQQKRD